MEFVPYIGPILAAAPPIVLAFFSSPWISLAVVIVFVFIQQVEGHILVPNIMGQAVGVHPLVVIFAVLAGANIYGIAGMLLALPLVALVRELYAFFKPRISLKSGRKERRCQPPKKVAFPLKMTSLNDLTQGKILVPKYVQYILLPLALLLGIWFISIIRTIIIMFALATIIAFVLDQPVSLMQEKLRMPRILAVVIVWLLLLGVVAGLMVLIIPNVISELNYLIDNIPEYTTRTESVVHDFQKWFGELDLPYKPDITPSGRGRQAGIRRRRSSQAGSRNRGTHFQYRAERLPGPDYQHLPADRRATAAGLRQKFHPATIPG